LAHAVEERVVRETEHPFPSRFTIDLERMWRGGLVKGQAEAPFTAPAIG